MLLQNIFSPINRNKACIKNPFTVNLELEIEVLDSDIESVN